MFSSRSVEIGRDRSRASVVEAREFQRSLLRGVAYLTVIRGCYLVVISQSFDACSTVIRRLFNGYSTVIKRLLHGYSTFIQRLFKGDLTVIRHVLNAYEQLFDGTYRST